MTTRSGGLWVATRATTATPGTDDSGWQLIVKKGTAMTRDEALQKALDAYDQAVSDRAADNLTALLADDVDPEQIADFIELSRDLAAQGREDFIAFTLGVLDGAEAGRRTGVTYRRRGSASRCGCPSRLVSERLVKSESEHRAPALPRIAQFYSCPDCGFCERAA